MESLARLASANGEARLRKGFSPIQTIQTLAEQGYLDDDLAKQLREMAKLRNAVVHGDFSVQVSAEQVKDRVIQLKAIATEILSMAPE